MRATLTALTLATAMAGFPVCAQEAGTEQYYAELANRCPDKQLQLLSPADLRDGLDDFASGLSPDQRDQLRSAERAQCSSLDAGVACVNTADIGAAEQLGLTSSLAASICSAFLRCRGQSDCDHAR